MKTWPLRFLLIFLVCLLARAVYGHETAVNVRSIWLDLIKKIPVRPDSALSGSEFFKAIANLGGSEREQAVLDQLAEGNLPDYLRILKPVEMRHRFEDGQVVEATIFVMPDYLSVGSDRDFLLMPMNLYTALEIAVRFGFILPTKKMVDQIYRQSGFHFKPQPLPAGPQMCSTDYYLNHNKKIREQRSLLCCPLDALVSGHKKDIVITNRLARAIGKIAIYGWHRLSGFPIQPLSTVHKANYADYSHGVRLVSKTVLINGEPRSIYDVLEDPKLSRILSDEGQIFGVRKLFYSSLMVLQHRNPR
jgi:hypothetical protein